MLLSKHLECLGQGYGSDKLSGPSCFMLSNLSVSPHRLAGPHASLTDLLNQEVITIVPIWQKGFSVFTNTFSLSPNQKGHPPHLGSEGLRCLHSGPKILHGIHQGRQLLEGWLTGKVDALTSLEQVVAAALETIGYMELAVTSPTLTLLALEPLPHANFLSLPDRVPLPTLSAQKYAPKPSRALLVIGNDGHGRPLGVARSNQTAAPLVTSMEALEGHYSPETPLHSAWQNRNHTCQHTGSK